MSATVVRPTASRAATRPRSGALDGIRGLFLAAPIVVHLQLAGGGNGLWLAIGLFFTLSGFLITSLLLNEIDKSGRVSLRAFWTRRFRRLIPASMLVLASTVAIAAWLDWPAMAALRDDILAALTWRANWHQLDAGGYWAGFAPSLTSHFWSLSLEEQLYLALPLAAVVGARLRDRVDPALTVATISAGAWLVSWAVLWTSTDPAELYLSTFTRTGEAAAGCFAAAIVHRRSVSVRRRFSVSTIVGALVIVEIPVWILCRGDTTSGLRWGITLSTPAVAIVVALLWRHPDSTPARFFSLPALVWLGRRSYGIYLIHIPVFDLLAHRLEVERLPAWAMVSAVVGTVGLAGLMFRVVEEPIRTSRWAPGPRRFGALLAAGTVTVVSLAVLTSRGQGQPFLPPEDVTPPVTTVVPISTSSANPLPTSSVPTNGEPTAVPTAPASAAPESTTGFPLVPGNVLVVGDSTAWVTFGAVRDSLEPLGWSASEVHMVGCPPGGDVRMKNSSNGGQVFVRELGEEPGCDLWWNSSLPSWLDDRQPTMVVVIDTYGLAYEIDPEGDDNWCRLADGSGRCEGWAAARLEALTRRIIEAVPATEIVWTTVGHIDPFGPLDVPAAAIDRLNELIRAEAGRADASIVDLGAWLDDHLDLTVDGTHLGPDGVAALTPWMAVELPAAAAGDRLASP
jgi:peptidoglycan/LPS O-acetylase OafA/YrhL